jgi:two-component system, chemotaxis family, sensor kinase Cph1
MTTKIPESVLIKNCDQEPVQFIGCVQEYGAVFLADPLSGKFTQVSRNAGSFVGKEASQLLGRPVTEVFGKVPSPGAIVTRFTCAHGEVSSYLKAGRWYFELEPAPASDVSWLSRQVREAMDVISQGAGWQEYLQAAAEQTAALLGYDRVMIYKFHPDLHGEVVAEKCRPGVDQFLGLHYPASDIPEPARKVFYENWVRMIPTIGYEPAPFEPELDPATQRKPDLSQTALRAVSPVHIEYLRNMAVAASLTISIKSEGRLWGLIACHHLSPKYLDREERAAAEMIGRYVSSNLRDASKLEEFEERRRLAGVQQEILRRLKHTNDLGKEMLQIRPNILDLIKADGSAAAVYVNGVWETIGEVPDTECLDKLADWLSQHAPGQEVFHTDNLSALYPDCEPFAGISAGLLAISIPKSRRSYVLFFRPEQIRTVRWAGNPDEKHPDETGRLHPRASFSEWAEAVRNRSAPWRSWEIDAAHELRGAIISADLQRQYEKEQEARQEAERAMRSREELMAVLSHDLKNPIGSITLQAALMERGFVKSKDAKNLELTKRIQRATQNMNTLINDILHVTSLEAGQLHMERKPESLVSVCQEVIEMLNPIALHNQLELRFISHTECQAEVDRERVIQVLSNLIGNALKFTPSGGSIEVALEKCGPEDAVLSVSDTGPGIPVEHHLFIFDRFWQANQAKRLGSGLGLAISKGIVEAHGGKIWVENREPNGTIFHFTLPLFAPR